MTIMPNVESIAERLVGLPDAHLVVGRQDSMRKLALVMGRSVSVSGDGRSIVWLNNPNETILTLNNPSGIEPSIGISDRRLSIPDHDYPGQDIRFKGLGKDGDLAIAKAATATTRARFVIIRRTEGANVCVINASGNFKQLSLSRADIEDIFAHFPDATPNTPQWDYDYPAEGKIA
jgi:hypothetical protein